MAEDTHPPADEPLLTPAPGVSDPNRLGRDQDALADAALPKQVGPYHVLELVGVGGMGEVYKAERRHPIRQTVAIKVIRLGFNSREVIARFDSERHVLARMDHPNVARALDAGVTDSRQPYFVMEYVPGVPITKFADDNKLSIKRRLELFCQACQAINHAHTKAIIHRDIKAANVLAYMHDDKPTVKVIDFGIAKALTGDRLTDATFNTEQGRIIGTYASMSPEQAEGSPDIDTRTDVYSLGVLLYELLTGSKPFDQEMLARAADHEVKRIIREVEPPRPSTRLSSLGSAATKVANLRDMPPDQLERDLRRELEWIPLKAMRKERARRYASALQLAEDIGNYLAGQPLIAGPETRTYRLQKYVTRHRAAVLTATAVLLLIGIGAALYIRGIRAEQARTKEALVEAGRQRGEAERRREEAEAVNSFLTEDVLSKAGPANLPDKAVRDAIIQRLINPADAAVVSRFKSKPLIEAAVRNSLALTYNAIGRADLGLPHATAALEIRRRLLGDDHPDTLASIKNMGLLLQAQGKLEAAEPLKREALERRRRVLGDDHPDTLVSINNMASLLQAQGKFAESEPLYREALERGRRVLGADHPDTLNSIGSMGLVLQYQGKLEAAEPLIREAVERYRQVLGDDHPDTLASINNMGFLLQAQGKLEAAEPLFREALERRRRVLGDDHPNTLISINNMGYLLQAQGKLEAAEPLFREALERRRRVLGDDHPDTLNSINNMGYLLYAQGKREAAEPLFREALDRRRRVLGDDHPETLRSINNLGLLLRAQGKLAEAEPLFREALERRRRVLGDHHLDTLSSINDMAGLLVARGKLDQAEPLYREALEHYRRVLGDDHRNTLRSINNMAVLLDTQGKLEAAEAMYREALERYRRVLGDDHPDTLNAINNMGYLLQARGKLEAAEPLYREALERRRRLLGDDHLDTLNSINNMGYLLYAQGKREPAEPLFREAATKAKTKLGGANPQTKRFAANHARCLDALGRHSDATAVRKEFGLPPATLPATTQSMP